MDIIGLRVEAWINNTKTEDSNDLSSFETLSVGSLISNAFSETKLIKKMSHW